MRHRFVGIIVVVALGLLFQGMAYAEGPVKPTEKDKCSVCGMHVAPYPNWVCEIVFKDGTRAFFDGPKDMFKFYFNIAKYNKAKTKADIESLYVTEYYTTRMVKAEDVYFVTGSDVMGPMGDELVAVKDKARAATFMKEHHGKKMLSFDEVTPADIPGGMMKMKGMKMKGKKMNGM